MSTDTALTILQKVDIGKCRIERQDRCSVVHLFEKVIHGVKVNCKVMLWDAAAHMTYKEIDQHLSELFPKFAEKELNKAWREDVLHHLGGAILELPSRVRDGREIKKHHWVSGIATFDICCTYTFTREKYCKLAQCSIFTSGLSRRASKELEKITNDDGVLSK